MGSRLSKFTEAPGTPGCGVSRIAQLPKMITNFMNVYQRDGGGNNAKNDLIGVGDDGDFLLGKRGVGDFAVDFTKYMKYR